MFLTHLSLTNFRAFSRLEIDLPSGSVLIIGSNGQGKTSLLEAIYFLATFTSFQASQDRQMINFISGREQLAVTRVVGEFQKDEISHRLEARLIQEANNHNGTSRVRKEVLFDGVKLKLHNGVGQFNAVLFLPQMLNVIEGEPEGRRRYLNLALAQTIPGYSVTLTEYSHAISQRNALLKQLSERGGDEKQLDFWDSQLAQNGARIINARIHAISELELLAYRFYQHLTRVGEIFQLLYQPSYDPFPTQEKQYQLPLVITKDRPRLSIEEIQQGFQDCLARNRKEEIDRGVTTVGPHRDDLRFIENGIDLGIYGSRGQIRTAIMAIKLAEVEWIRTQKGQWPILLCDELLAELDAQHRRDLLAQLTLSEQTLLTTTDLDLFSKEFIKNTTLLNITGGQIVSQ